MNTTINLTYKGDKYTLEYDRSTIKALEKGSVIIESAVATHRSNWDSVSTLQVLISAI